VCAGSQYRSAGMSTPASPIGCVGRVARQGAIRPGRTGEVMIAMGGGVQAFMARDADGGSIDAFEEIVVVDRIAERTLLVTRLRDVPPDPEEIPSP
jgi:hypothetical protein